MPRCHYGVLATNLTKSLKLTIPIRKIACPDLALEDDRSEFRLVKIIENMKLIIGINYYGFFKIAIIYN